MKEIFKQPIFLIISFFVILFIYSKFGPNLPISVLTQTKGAPLVVSEEGTTTVVPDIASVNLGIEETGANLKAVQNSLNQKSQKLVQALKGLGVGEKEIKTTSYNLYPVYDYQSQPAKITGYRVAINYQVKVKNMEKINEVLTKATEVGANQIGSITFEVNDEAKGKALQTAREEAVGRAKTKAQGLAKAAGISLGKIINISETQEGNIPRPYAALEKSAVGTSNSVTPDIQPGETEIKVIVTLSWEIR